MRWIHSFFKALEAYLHGVKNQEDIDYEKPDQIGQKYFHKEISFFLQSPISDIIPFFKK